MGNDRFMRSMLSVPSLEFSVTTKRFESRSGSPAVGEARITSPLVKKLSRNAERMHLALPPELSSRTLSKTTDVGVRLQLPLKLALHRPVECFVQDVGFGDAASKTFRKSSFAGMTSSGRNEDQSRAYAMLQPASGSQNMKMFATPPVSSSFRSLRSRG